MADYCATDLQCEHSCGAGSLDGSSIIIAKHHRSRDVSSQLYIGTCYMATLTSLYMLLKHSCVIKVSDLLECLVLNYSCPLVNEYYDGKQK